MMTGIKNIIFDLGGVVIDLQRKNAIEALERLGVKSAGKLLGEYGQKGAFGELESGRITSSELYDLLLPECRQGTTCSDLRDAFEAFLDKIPVERLETIRALRDAGYKVFVLSNTNPIMMHHWIEESFRAEGLTINDYFDGIVVSFQERTMKPDPHIFEILLKRYHLEASETIMFDDSEQNCESAKSVGMQAITIEPTGKNSFSEVCSRLLDKRDS